MPLFVLLSVREFGGIPDFRRRAMPFDVDCKLCTYVGFQKKYMGLRSALDWNEVEFKCVNGRQRVAPAGRP